MRSCGPIRGLGNVPFWVVWLKLGGGLALAVAHHFAWKFLCLGLFAWLSLRLEILPMLILGGLLYGVTFLQRWWTLRRMVGVINAESVVRMMEDDPASLDRSGEDRVVTVLFADIRSFSTFSENHSAREVVGLLNAYFTAVVPVVERHGGTLNQYMGDGMTIAQAVRVAGEMGPGLAAAHARGMIHRDIKPGNIWLERRAGDASEYAGRVKLLDFGLARVAGTTELTMPGTVVGTPAYMSPEQARGQDLDARSDLFSLGTVLYRLVTGRLPFNGESAAAILRAIEEHEPPRPSELRPEVPAGLDRLIGELLSKRPEDRPASAQEVVARLRTL